MKRYSRFTPNGQTHFAMGDDPYMTACGRDAHGAWAFWAEARVTCKQCQRKMLSWAKKRRALADAERDAAEARRAYDAECAVLRADTNTPDFSR